jgi:hypothetical protein
MKLHCWLLLGIFCWPVYLSATDWNAAAVRDAETLLQNDIDSGQSRNPLGLLFAMGIAVQRHTDLTKEEAGSYAAAFVGIYMQQLRVKGEELAGKIPPLDAENKVIGAPEFIRTAIAFSHPDTLKINSEWSFLGLVRPANQNNWYWATQFQYQCLNSSNKNVAGQLYLYARDGKLDHAWIDPDSVREIESKSVDQ